MPTIYRSPYTWENEAALLHQFKARANFHKVKVSGEAVNADMVATQEFPEMLLRNY